MEDNPLVSVVFATVVIIIGFFIMWLFNPVFTQQAIGGIFVIGLISMIIELFNNN